MRNVKLVELDLVDTNAVNAMLQEYAANGEQCKPMNFLQDTNTRLYVIMDGSLAVGMVRKTSTLYRECHGKFGISVRPAERGKGYGRAAMKEAKVGWKCEPTACIDRTNVRSIRMFERAGWERTGREFDWKNDRKAIEFAPKKQYKD